MNKNIQLDIEKALKLRSHGLTLGEIALEMNRSLSTVKRWMAPFKSGIPESIKKKLRIAGLKGALRVKEKHAALRNSAYLEAKKTASEDLQDKFLRDFINLYIGEGTKKMQDKFTIVNSDPKIILISLVIIKKFFLKEGKRIYLEIRYYKENNNENELLNYWKNITNNDSLINYKTYLQPTIKALGHNNSNKFGLVFVNINDVYARQKLNAYMDYLKEEWTKEFEKMFNISFDRDMESIKSIAQKKE